MRYQWPDAGKVQLMGILNLTPDSFSDGGRYNQQDAALRRAEKLMADGADILDIGGESTRPGAAAIAANEELDRVMPVLQALRDCGLPLSVDTSKAVVMRAALGSGAAIINDVMALQAEGAVEAVAASTACVCLMHMRGEPRTMQQAPQYADVVREVGDFLWQRAQLCEQAGIERARISIDPGFGFGKSSTHNLQLLHRLPQLHALRYPLLVGLSRKSLIGQITGCAVDERVNGSVVLALIAAQQGARVLRVHDVKETRDALRLWQAVQQEQVGVDEQT